MPVLVLSLGFFLVLIPTVMIFDCFVGGGDDPSIYSKGSDFGSAVPPSSQAESPLSPCLGKSSRISLESSGLCHRHLRRQQQLSAGRGIVPREDSEHQQRKVQL